MERGWPAGPGCLSQLAGVSAVVHACCFKPLSFGAICYAAYWWQQLTDTAGYY